MFFFKIYIYIYKNIFFIKKIVIFGVEGYNTATEQVHWWGYKDLFYNARMRR